MTLPIIGQGTWNLERATRKQAITALHRGIDMGLTHIDTAELYGNGAVERLVGEALQGRRRQVYLVSKILPEHASRKAAVRHCEYTLRRLGTDHLDCYLLHWLGPVPFEETVAAFDRLVRDGKVRAWGVSNFDEVKLDELLRVAGEGTVACNQVLYHLEERSIEHAVIPFCEQRGIAVVGYSPFGSGRFPFPSPRATGGRVLAEVAEAHGATARQVVLAFLARHPGSFVVPKASRIAHLEDNAGAGAIELTAEDVARIDRAFPRGPRRHGVPLL